MLEPIEVTVVLPCLNEADTVGVCAAAALSSLREHGVACEVVVADNGSSDGSAEIAVTHGARVIAAPVKGYGGALLAGIAAARGQYVIMADADDSYDLANLGTFVDALRQGHDLVMGNRFAGGIAPGAMPHLHRYLGNPVLSMIGRRLFHLSIGDFHCGIRGFRRDRIQELGLCLPGMEFASEMVVRAALAGLDVTEIPTTLRPDGRNNSQRHLRTWRDGWRHLRFLLIFAPRQTLIYPGAVLAVISLIGTVLLTTGPRDVDGIVFDVNALVYACLGVLVGCQLILMGGVAKVYGSIEGLVSGREHARWSRVMRLEVAGLAGAILMAMGLLGTLRAVSTWHTAGFGPLDPRATIRLVVPSATSVALGLLVLCFGLVGSLLTVRGLAPISTPGSLDNGLDEKFFVDIVDEPRLDPVRPRR